MDPEASASRPHPDSGVTGIPFPNPESPTSFSKPVRPWVGRNLRLLPRSAAASPSPSSTAGLPTTGRGWRLPLFRLDPPTPACPLHWRTGGGLASPVKVLTLAGFLCFNRTCNALVGLATTMVALVCVPCFMNGGRLFSRKRRNRRSLQHAPRRRTTIRASPRRTESIRTIPRLKRRPRTSCTKTPASLIWKLMTRQAGCRMVWTCAAIHRWKRTAGCRMARTYTVVHLWKVMTLKTRRGMTGVGGVCALACSSLSLSFSFSQATATPMVVFFFLWIV